MRILPAYARPIAVRLTLVATAASAAALLLVLGGLYVAVTSQLDATVGATLSRRAAVLAPAVAREGGAALSDEPLSQLYGGGALVTSSPGLRGRRLLRDGTSLREGQRVAFTRTLHDPSGRAIGPLRILAVGLAGGRQLVLAASVQTQIEAGERLLAGLSVAGPVVLLLVALVVHRAVRSALRPVDVLTREAAQIGEAHDPGRRLSLVAGDDEVARLAGTLDSMLQRLEDAFDRERAFVDDASHELRTPLAVLRGELELALSDLSDPAALEVSLRAATYEAERLSRLAEDLLVLARQRSPGAPRLVEAVDLPALLRETGRRLGGELDVRVVAPASTWWGDRARLEQVLGNLLANAAAAGAARVVLAAGPGDAPVLDLSVEDDGPGFPPDFLAHAFERFSRADVARTRSSGAGLGLALVETIVRAADGEVWAANDSRLGGAAVRLRLPVRPEHAGLDVPAGLGAGT